MRQQSILLIDDDSEFLAALNMRCQRLGLKVSQARNLLTALTSIEKHTPDVICLDVAMPTGNGLSFCQMLREDTRTKGIPIAIVTGNEAATTRRVCRHLGVHYVSKSGRFWSKLEPFIRQTLDRPPQSQFVTDGHQQLRDAAFLLLTGKLKTATSTPKCEADMNSQQINRRMAILCIDDDQDFCDALSLRFAEFGISVLQAREGMDGYRTAFFSPVCAIVLDYMMPNGRGDYILMRLMDNPVTKDIPVIVVTGNNDKMLERKMIAMGAKACLKKPLEFTELKNALDSALCA